MDEQAVLARRPGSRKRRGASRRHRLRRSGEVRADRGQTAE